MDKHLIRSVFNTIKRFDMLEKSQKVLVAVSGGPDSIFLFHVLYNLRENFKIKLFIANLDHGIRGAASQVDSMFVRHISESFNIPFVYNKINLKVYKDNELSKEEIARRERYDFLVKSAKRLGADVIATGHTLDDHVETILMRIIKGTTLKGVMGIPPVRSHEGVKIIRPLIEITKEDIEGFLEKNTIPCRTDNTNLEDLYFRNKVRNRILPYLKQYNPRIKSALANLADNLREDFEFIEEERSKRKSPLYSDNGKITLRLKDIIIQPKALRREIVKDALTKAGSNIKKLSYKHWKDMDNFIKLKEKGKAIDLPGSIRVKKDKDTLVFFKLKGIK